MLEVSGLHSGYGSISVLHGLSMHLDDGEILAILGPNGAGKSTLLKTISGVIRATDGEVVLDGRPITRLAPHRIGRLGLGHVPEGRWLFPTMSVEENLLVGGYTIKERRVRERRLSEVLELFPRLSPRIKVAAGSLSGGEQQMVAIARALMPSPRMLMFDEPSLGLAPIVQEQVQLEIVRLHELGIAILLVEQNVELALEIADRAYVMRVGDIVLEGSAGELRASGAVTSEYMGANAA
jgi:branched-chain amino acid transport system ATP-binding protein